VIPIQRSAVGLIKAACLPAANTPFEELFNLPRVGPFGDVNSPEYLLMFAGALGIGATTRYAK
jgi:hypothetical protein